MLMIPRTLEFWNGAFVVQVGVPQKQNKNQEVKIIEEYFIIQTNVKLLAKVKAQREWTNGAFVVHVGVP